MTMESLYLRDADRGLREPGPSVLDRIPIEESGEGLADLREVCPHIGVSTTLPWARRTVCRMLCEAAARLPEGLGLHVVNAFRTLDTQAAAWHTYRDHLRELHPSWPTAVLHRETNRFIHPPNRRCPPGHTTGAAVDVHLVDARGEPLEDLATILSAGHGVWRTFSTGIPEESRRLRAVLYDAMVGVGFSNCVDEWWHYSWGDSGWAGRVGQPVAVYSAVPEECFPEPLGQVVAEMRAANHTAQLRAWLGASLRGEDPETAPQRPGH